MNLCFVLRKKRIYFFTFSQFLTRIGYWNGQEKLSIVSLSLQIISECILS